MIHHVFANRSSAGDLLSAMGIRALLGPVEVREHLCDFPFVPDTLRELAKATEDDLVVIGGGGLFMDYFTPFWQGFLPIARRVPTCIWGVGYVDLKAEPSRAPRALLEQVVRASRLCYVRDELTRMILANCNLPPSVPCPSFVAVRPEPLVGRGLLHAANYTAVGERAYEETCRSARLFAAQSHRRYAETNNRFEDERGLDGVLERYRTSDLIVSSRLHGCIVGIAMGRKVLAVSGDRKIEGFMQSAGLGDWVLEHDRLELLPRRLRALEEQTVPREFLEHAVRANERIAAEVQATLPRPVVVADAAQRGDETR